MIVIDTNVIAYLLIEGEHTAQAELVWTKDSVWVAPKRWRSEFRDIVALYVRQGYLSLEDAQQLVNEAEALACIIHDDFEKASKAFPGNQSGDLLKKQSVFGGCLTIGVLAIDELPRLEQFGASTHADWSEGIYFLHPGLRSAIISINRLPVNPNTLWLRLLGRGKTQQQAI
jgi:hypothetical protein